MLLARQSENEEAHDKVRARSAMTTDPVEGTMELGHQIAKLMAALSRAGQDRATAQPVPQIDPDREGMGGDRWTGALLAAPAPILAKLVWDRLPQPTVHLSAVAQEPPLVEPGDRAPKDLKKIPPTRGIPTCSSASGARVGAIWLGNAPLEPKL